MSAVALQPQTKVFESQITPYPLCAHPCLRMRAHRHANGKFVCSSFHAQLPRINKHENLMGTRVQLFVNNVPTAVSMVLDRDLICCFDDGSYRLSSADLEGMALRPGKNSIRYEMIHSLNNDRRYSVRADIHLWNFWDKIVVVDIDGTVTKTDVAGFGAEKLGYEYIHQGVCEAVSHIAKLGYRILFLTSRAITLAQSTREFLRSIGFANGGTGMPDFALITTTERFLQSLVVGVRSADKFKTVALSEILKVFQPDGLAMRTPEENLEAVPGWRQDTSPSFLASSADKHAIWRAPDAEDDEASNASTEGSRNTAFAEQVHSTILFPDRVEASKRRAQPAVVAETEAEGAAGSGQMLEAGEAGAGVPQVDEGRQGLDQGLEGNSSGPNAFGSEDVRRVREGSSGGWGAGIARRTQMQTDSSGLRQAKGADGKTCAAHTPPQGQTGLGNRQIYTDGPAGVFACGFGNRLTDTAAYHAVGVAPVARTLCCTRAHACVRARTHA